jgi:phosphatidylinositol alpha-1,6-mannosyltransferase
LRNTLINFKPEIVLLTSDLAHGIGALTCYRFQIPFVAVVHGSEIVKHFPPKNIRKSIQSPWLKFCYSKANAVFCVSSYVRELMLNAGFAAHKLYVIHNGIDDRLLTIPKNFDAMASLKNRYELHNKKVILTIARLVSRKGQEQMIRAMPAILSRDANIGYVIVGTGEDEMRLKQLAKDHNVEHAIIFTGEISERDTIDYLDLCDVFVFLSRSDGVRVEGLGIALLEAAARGKPLIGTFHGGINEIIDDGIHGYLVEPSDVEQIAERAVTILNNPALAKNMGERARKKVSEYFTATKMARQTKHRLEIILNLT